MKFCLCVSAVLAFALLGAQAHAIGIAPGRMEMDFEPYFDNNISFQIRSSADSTTDFRLYASGDLARYIRFEKDTVTLEPGEIRTVTFNMKLPAALEPGRHDNAIGLLEVLPTNGGMAAQVGVEMQLWVKVPYPDSYIAVDIANTGPVIDQKMTFTVTLGNPARNDLATTANMEVRDVSDTVIERFELGSAYIRVGESRQFEASWTPKKTGDYKVVARASYVGETTTKEKAFTVKTPATAPVPAFVWEEAPPNLIPYAALIVVLVIAIIMVVIWPKDARK